MAAFNNPNLAILDTAETVVLPSGTSIRLITAPVFIGTKLEAFKDRGKHASGKADYLGSHDLEDIITVADRRPELLAECRAAAPELRAYMAAEFTALFFRPRIRAGVVRALAG